MKKYILTLLLSLSTATSSVFGLTWNYSEFIPFVYSVEDEAWLYFFTDDDALYSLNTDNQEVSLLAPALGFSPASLIGETFLVTAGDSATFTFGDGSFTETDDEGTLTGVYEYTRSGDNTGLLVLIYPDNREMASGLITYTTAISGDIDFTFVSAPDNEFETVEATFTVQ